MKKVCQHLLFVMLVVFSANSLMAQSADKALHTDGVAHHINLPEGLGPTTLTIADDGRIWFTLSAGNAIGRVEADGSHFVKFDLPNAGSSPRVMSLGSDGSFWFSEHEGNRIGRITVDGEISSWVLPTQNSQPRAVALGGDGNIWIGQFAGNRIGRITPTGGITEFIIPTTDSGPRALAAGPDGNVWFSEFKAGKIGRINPQGEITEYALPGGELAGPGDITAGADGAMWFVMHNGFIDGMEKEGNRIGRMSMTGEFSSFPIPSPDGTPINIAVGPDENIWYTKNASLGRVTPTGEITEYAVANGTGRTVGLTAGSDREVPDRLFDRLWFTDPVNNRIGYLQFSH